MSKRPVCDKCKADCRYAKGGAGMSKKWLLYVLMLNAYWAGVMVMMASEDGWGYLVVAALNVVAVTILGGQILEGDE